MTTALLHGTTPYRRQEHMRRYVLWITAFFFLCLTPPAARAERPLLFAYQNRIGDAVSIVAVNKGFFSDEKLDVKALQLNNGAACSDVLFTGAVDIAAMGDTAALLAVARRPDLRIIASHGAGERRHRIIIPGNSRVKSIADLKGKQVGIKKGTSAHGGFLALLASKGISPAEVEMIDLDPALMPDALSAPTIDAFVASEPTPSHAEERGGKELADLGGLGSNYPLLLLIKAALIEKRDDELKRFVRALKRAEQFISRHPDEAAEILCRETGLKQKAVRSNMKRHTYRIQLDAATVKSLKETAAFLKKQNMLDRLPDLSAAIDGRYLEKKASHEK